MVSWGDSECGPTFGSGHDINIGDNSNTKISCCSQLSCSYDHPQYEFETDEAQAFLAGSYKFQLDEIEVYQKE